MLWLVECKHYGHPVSVDDVEEFYAKVQQVAAAKSKAIIVTTNSFQSGAFEFARSKGIGLLRLFPKSEFKWELYRSPSSLPMSRSLSRDWDILSGLTQEDYHSRRFDFFCSAEDVFTYSLHDFFLALSSDAFDTTSLLAIAANRDDTELVPFIGGDEIERRCRAVHSAIGYKCGAVSLETISEWNKIEAGLSVLTNTAPSREEAKGGILGRISFDPPAIIVFFDRVGARRQRFTLAHELAHLLLGHGAYMQGESVDEEDIESDGEAELGVDDIRRLEWQANFFASCLLLPRDSFVASSLEKAHEMDLINRGHGLIFLDQQPVNIHNYQLFTSALMTDYEVSRTAVSIRLKSLGLLNDSWTRGQ